MGLRQQQPCGEAALDSKMANECPPAASCLHRPRMAHVQAVAIWLRGTAWGGCLHGDGCAVSGPLLSSEASARRACAKSAFVFFFFPQLSLFSTPLQFDNKGSALSEWCLFIEDDSGRKGEFRDNLDCTDHGDVVAASIHADGSETDKL